MSDDVVPPAARVQLFDEDGFCAWPGCTVSVDDDENTCWQCHQNFCGAHTTHCENCGDACCPPHILTADNGSNYCTQCSKGLTACCVCNTVIHTEDKDTKFCDSHDKYCCDGCYSGYDVCNDCYSPDGEDTTADHGLSEAAPWEARGVHDPGKGYDEAPSLIDESDPVKFWGIDNSLSLNAGAADFYLLEPIQHNVDCGEIAEPMLVIMAEEAKTMRKQLVAAFDPAFIAYADMAIGGELRYHKAVGDNRHLPVSRFEAWKYWKLLRTRGGPDILLDTAALFREIRGGSVGGEAWAMATDLLHARLTGRITPEQWVDRCWTLQHNGGAFTNKICWGPHGTEYGNEIRMEIGPAHDADPTNFDTLLKYASPAGARLFREWWLVANRNRQRWRIRQWVRLNEADRLRVLHMRQWFKSMCQVGWAQPSIQKERLAQWDTDPRTYEARFKAFYLQRVLSYDYGIGVAWHSIDPAQYRIIVDRVLDTTRPMTTYATLHLHAPTWLNSVCKRIVSNAHEQQHERLFKVLSDRGVVIPSQFHGAAGIAVQSSLALD